MRSLAGSLADCVLADTILIPPHPLILPTNKEGNGSSKDVRKLYSNTKTIKKGVLGWLNPSLQSTEKRDELSTTLHLQSKRCLSAPDARSLYHCLKNKLLKLKCFQW